jgi:RimJ/RimL family protein N-acetyltransferase
VNDELRIRPATPDDVPAADAVARDVLFSLLPGVHEAERRRRSHARIAHLIDTDPGGAWVAERADGRVAGVGLALIRDGIWGFSLFAVAEDVQGQGVGRRLLEACFRYGEAARGHLILSSENPAAMRRYARLGLEIRPAVAAAGIADLARMPAAVARVEDAGATGIPLADAIGRRVRGAGHARDLPVALASGASLLTFEDRAFAVARDGNVVLLAALDDEAASLVLWAALQAAGPGATVRVDFLTAGQDWAVRTCLDAGLPLSPDGPMFTGGHLGPLRPYIPSGAYL